MRSTYTYYMGDPHSVYRTFYSLSKKQSSLLSKKKEKKVDFLMPPASATCGGGPARDRGRTSAALSVSGIAEPVSRGHSALYHTVLYQYHTVASELCWAVGSSKQSISG